MNLKQNILNNYKKTALDCSDSLEAIKAIFSRHNKATAGSSCCGFRKKTLRTRAIAQSWNRLKKNKVIVKVHCTEHEYGMVNVTLWEDDAKGKGHNKINEKNFAQTKPAEVKRGIAETKFVLSPSFAKMVEAQKAKGDSSEGTTHEYYVTATIKNKNDASNNIEVNVPPAKPVPPLKKRVPVQTQDRPLAPIAASPKKPVVPVVPAKPVKPATPSTTPGITNVVLTKTSATTMHAAIYHNKLHGKKIRFKLMEDDGGKLVDDELVNEIYTFPKDTNYLYIAINLKAISVSKGGTFTQEGFYQELFVDVEVLETHKQTKTGTLNVDIAAFKPDPADITNKVVKIWESIFRKDKKEKKKKKKEKSVCTDCEEKFKKVAPIILIHEGGYKNQPTKDKGDPTNKGISWPIWIKYAKADLDIEPTAENQKELSDDNATIIYRKRYWEPQGYFEINDLKVALMIYDWSITSGGAIKEVQKVLVNDFGQTLTIDGGMGSETAKIVNNVTDQITLLNKIAEKRREYYVKGAEEGWFSKDYSKGLDNRVTKCLNYDL